MLKTAVSNSIDLPATNCFTCNCSRSVRKANIKQIPFMQMSSSLSAPAAPVCQDTHNHSHISSNVHGSINSGLGMEYAFRLPPAQPLPFTSCGFEQASHMNLSQPCCLSRLDNDNNANIENFCPNVDLNTDTFTNTSHCVCKRKQQKQNKHNKINDVNSISSINSSINGISDSGFIVNVPKSKTANKNGPGFDSVRKKDGCWIKPNYYNRYTSCVIENTPDQVINGLLIICAHYGNENQSENGNGGGNGGSVFEDDSNSASINTFSREIEYRLNKQDFIIDGIVFVKHKPIKFQISVWHDSDDMDIFSPVRVEFQKTRGDSALFHLFWSEMLELMETFTLENNSNKNTNNNNNKLFGTISDCTRSGNSCLETFLLPMPLPKLPKQENKKFTEIDGTSEEDIQDSQMNKEKQNDHDDLANKINFNNENEKEKEQMQEQQLNDDFMDDTIGGMSIDLESEYKYTKGDLDDMVLDLISNYRDEALDVLATICNTLESNLQFRKLFCQHNKMIETIGSVIINKQNYNNMAKLRGGLCVLLKLIGKKTVEPEPQLATQKLQDIQETAEELEKRLQLETPTTATITTLTNKLAKIASHDQDTTQPANSPAKQQQHRKKLLGFNLSYLDVTRLNFNGSIKEDTDHDDVLTHDGGEDNNNKIENESESEIGNAYEEKAGGSEVESVIECLVNETNILKEFPLLLQNSSKIVQNHTIRLMNSMFEYIPEKLKLTKNVTDKIIFLNSHDK